MGVVKQRKGRNDGLRHRRRPVLGCIPLVTRKGVLRENVQNHFPISLHCVIRHGERQLNRTRFIVIEEQDLLHEGVNQGILLNCDLIGLVCFHSDGVATD